nr:A/G-specific adenine glycosylase [Lachnospiraceae bacterium]
MVTDNIVKPLLAWYDQNKRILPWRENRDPYRIWVSEIMLQQTRVEAVKPYYDRFLKQLPDVESLAEVQEEHLLKLWEGLGYYNRVKNMQKAALVMKDVYEGRMPEEYELLLQLPGIGSYTAGAIASIAFGKPVVAVDGNVLRIITRLTADPSDILSEKFKKQVREQLLTIVPADRPGDFNQALMELGATVCLPNGAPKCHACPWHDICMARQQGRLDEIPYKKKKKPRVIEEKTVLLLRDGEKTLIR